jgi:hypothetical protein
MIKAFPKSRQRLGVRRFSAAFQRSRKIKKA